ncbi:MAG: hypothetical protein JNK15_23600 [Planctomycetes bacterium]|nr:hypothetical protein [Planctomycetota bacterium]
MSLRDDDSYLAAALARADARHPPAPGAEWSPGALHAAVRRDRQRRLLAAGIAVTTLTALVLWCRTPAAAATNPDDASLSRQVAAMQAELRALRASLHSPRTTTPLQPTDADRAFVRLELARAGAEACRAFPQPIPKETR